MAARFTPGLIGSARWNLVAFACGLAANLLTVPFVVRSIGLEAFGLAGLVIAVCAPFLVVGTVLGQALVREMSVRLGAGDEAGADRFLPAALKLCALAGAAGWLILVLGGPAVVGWISEPGVGTDELRLIFIIAATGWLAQQFALVFQGASTARMNYRAVAKVSAVYAAMSAATILVFTHAFPSALAFVAAVSASYAVLLVGWCVALRHLPWRGSADGEIQALLGFSSWQGIAHIVGNFSLQIDRYLLGALFPVATVGEFNVARRVQEAGSIGLMKMGEVLFPRFGSLSTKSPTELARFFRTACWCYCSLGAAVLIPAAVLSRPLIDLWIPEESIDLGATMLFTLLVAAHLGTAAGIFNHYLMGTGNTRVLTSITVVFAGCIAALSIPTINVYGPTAAGVGTLVASALRNVLVVWWLRRLMLDLSRDDIVVCLGLPLVIGSSFAFLSLAYDWSFIDNWIALGSCYTAVAALILGTIVAGTALSDCGRELLVAVWRRVIHRR